MVGRDDGAAAHTWAEFMRQCHERGLPAEVLDAARFSTKRAAEHVAHQHGGFARRVREVK
jgi:hypothetical protein